MATMSDAARTASTSSSWMPIEARLPAAPPALEVVHHLVAHALDLGLDVGLGRLGLVDGAPGPSLDVGLGRLGVVEGTAGLGLDLVTDAGELVLEAADRPVVRLEVLPPGSARHAALG